MTPPGDALNANEADRHSLSTKDLRVRFYELIRDAVELCEREGRVGIRALGLHLSVDTETLEDVVEELCGGRGLASLTGDTLVWRGTTPPGEATRDAGDVACASPGAGVALAPLAERVRDRPRTAPPALEERRQLTIMFCDLVGSTTLSDELDPEDLRDVVTRYQHTAARAVVPHGGFIAEYLGDGIVVYFGYPRAYEDAPVRAVRAACAVRDAIAAQHRAAVGGQRTLSVRIGVHTGLVVMAEIGERGRTRPAALGQAPNIAARLQALAGPDEIVVSETSARLVRGFFVLEPLGAQALRGIARNVRVSRVAGRTAAETRFEAVLAGSLSRFVGRGSELAELRDMFAAAKGGAQRTVWISGDPGIGKSRLVQQLIDEVRGCSGQRLVCRCSPQHASTAYYPWIDLLQRRCGLAAGDARAAQVQKVEAALSRLGLASPSRLRTLAAMVGVELLDDSPHAAATPQRQKQDRFELLEAVLSNVTQTAPTILVVEDVHWLDPTSEELLASLSLPGTLVVLTSRPLARPPAALRCQDVGHILLGRLPETDAHALLTTVASGRMLPHALTAELLRRTDGVPLFIEEQLRAVLDSGLLVETDGAYALAGSVSHMPIAETLQDSLLARLDALDRDSRRVAQLAATLGRKFPFELLEAVSTLPPGQLHNALARLLDAGLLTQHGSAEHATYVFKHALVQDAAYQSLLRSTRQKLHRTCAEALTAGLPTVGGAAEEVIAQHWRDAAEPEQAILCYTRAGKAAAAQWALREASDHLRSAQSLLDALEPGARRRELELEVLFALGPILISLRGDGSPEVQRCYARTRALCEQIGASDRMFVALMGVWQNVYVAGALARAHELGQELVAVAQELGDATMRLVAVRALASTMLLRGDLCGALEHASACWAMYDLDVHGQLGKRLGHDPGVAAGIYRAWALWLTGAPDQAMAQALANTELAQRLHDPTALTYSRSYAAMIAILCGDLDRAEALATAAEELADAREMVLFRAIARTQRGWARSCRGDTATGLALLREGTDAWRATGAAVGGSLLYAALAEGHLASGDLAGAERSLEAAESICVTTGERFHTAELFRLRARLAQRRGEAQSSLERTLAQGLAVARTQGARSWELRLTTDLAELRAAAGDSAAARALLAPVVARFCEGHGTRDHAAARAVLSRLS